MKHAIVMMAHNNIEVVRICLKILDDDRFFFLIHIDKKSEFAPSEFIPYLEKSQYMFLKRDSINWGGWSYSKKVIEAIQVAVENKADYIHILQGADLPLKTPDEIDKYITENKW